MNKKQYYKIVMSIILLITSIILAFKSYNITQKQEWHAGASKWTCKETMEYFGNLISQGYYEVLPAYDEAKDCYSKQLRTRWILAIASVICFASSAIFLFSLRRKGDSSYLKENAHTGR